MKINLKNNSKEEGFTLLEVLISFVILSGVLGIIYQLLSTGTLQSVRSNNEAQALLIAKSKMTVAEAGVGVNEGEIEGYKWISEVKDVTTNNEGETQARLLNIKVIVRWNEFRGERSLNLETLKLLPEER